MFSGEKHRNHDECVKAKEIVTGKIQTRGFRRESSGWSALLKKNTRDINFIFTLFLKTSEIIFCCTNFVHLEGNLYAMNSNTRMREERYIHSWGKKGIDR